LLLANLGPPRVREDHEAALTGWRPRWGGRLLPLLLLPSAAFLPFALFQRKLLPHSLARPVGRAYFWPTLPLTLWRSWLDGRGLWCEVDDTLMMGVVPVPLLGHPSQLRELGVRAVVNMLDEYSGPEAEYEQLQIEQLRLPTVDHTEPSVDDLLRACKFIDAHRAKGGRVYAHCKAGHGRAGAVALAWMAYSRGLSGEEDLRQMNEELLEKRRVRPRLHQQPFIRAFASRLKEESAK